jgi:hypothetical protein
MTVRNILMRAVSGVGFFDFIFDTAGPASQLTLGVSASPSLIVATALLVFGNETNEQNFTNTNYFRDGATGSIVPEVSSTPLPAALPLFATGLGALGFLAKRRKRKNASIAAA